MADAMARSPSIVASLVLLCLPSGAVWGEQPRDSSYVLTVKRMDCPAESAPAMEGLSKVPGVKSVSVDYKAVTLSIVPKRNARPSPLAVWEVAERARIEPIMLQTAHGTYYSKPRR